MKIKVFLYDVLKTKLLPDSEERLIEAELKTGATVQELVQYLNLPEEWVGLILLNGRQVERKLVLSDQDNIVIFSPMAGG